MKGKYSGRLIRVYSFLAGVVGIILAACIFPEWGAQGGVLKAQVTSKIAVCLVFLVHGLILDTHCFSRSFANWRLHAFTQGFIFGVIPFFVYLILELFGKNITPDLKLGFMFLALLPTTISSCIMFTDRVEGNVAAAIFNASFSNILGVFFVPFGIYLYASYITLDLDLFSTVVRIGLLIVLPLLIGQLLRIPLLVWINKYQIILKKISRVLVLYVIYTAFCTSIEASHWSEFSLFTIFIVGLLAFVLMVLISILVLLGARWLKFDYEDSMAAFFCSSQKTVVAGVPLAQSLITGDVSLGIVLMPLLFYHTFQLFFGVLVSWRKVSGLNLKS